MTIKDVRRLGWAIGRFQQGMGRAGSKILAVAQEASLKGMDI